MDKLGRDGNHHMTEEAWLLHKNLLKWLHAQQRLMGVKSIPDYSYYNTPLIPSWPGMTEDIRRSIFSHLMTVQTEIKNHRRNHQFRSPHVRNIWKHKSSSLLQKAIHELDSHIQATKIIITNKKNSVCIDHEGSSKRRAVGDATFVISPAYFKSVGLIYDRIGYLKDCLIMHSSVTALTFW